MLYKKNAEKQLSPSLFKNPTSEYRGTPFWAWNSYLTKDELCRQIDVFKEMGLGGFHMHVRTGLENEYLSAEYMDLVKACVDKAKGENMLAWLYDEDRWPSGAAGGIVTKDIKYRSRSLLFTPKLKGELHTFGDSSSEGGRTENGKLIACYDILLDDDGYLASYRRIGADDKAEGKKWYAFLEISGTSGWYNNQTYVDTLSKEAIEKFVEVTHEKYLAKVGDEFDKTVPAIFTDEPQFTRKKVLNNSFDEMDITMPWTDKVPEIYTELYGEDIFETLPEIFWDLPDSAPSLPRYRYHDMIAELFARSFADTVGGWCKKNNLYLTGHMMEEPSLNSQTAALGEAMRSYRSFGLPGIDMLCNRCEYTTAKQAQSATHQFGYEGVLSELYGVTGWDCDFRTYKFQGDWQACLGITVRVPHLSWYAMKGEAKRDYPASISYQSPWYKEYGAVEDHFARVNTALTRGKPVVKVGVIHPVESFWLHWGPNDKSAVLRENLDQRFENVTEWLLKGSVDFDFISESLLPQQCAAGSAPLQVGQMKYDAIVVPGCETLRSTTIERLAAFKAAGGKLIFMGSAPTLCDAVPSDKGKALFDGSVCIDFSRSSLLAALESERAVTLRNANGRFTDNLIYQLREDNDCKWLFVCHSNEPYNKDVDGGNDIQIIINGTYAAELYDTASGDIKPVYAEYRNGKTVIRTKVYAYDSLLYKLTQGENKADTKPAAEKLTYFDIKEKEVDYRLSGKNVYLLDMAEFKLDFEDEFSPAEEVLRLDNIARHRIGLGDRDGGVAQPWCVEKVAPTNRLTLRYTIFSDIDYEGAELALEDVDVAEITFNGEKVANNSLGKYVDITIDRVALPKINKGTNTLVVTIPFGLRTNTEAMFILGDFGVNLKGRKATITELPEKISFGDITVQGFPFYGDNITYLFDADAENGSISLCASDYRGALIGVEIDGEKKGRIIYPPYTLTVDGLENGRHTVGVTLYTHRYNSFGPVHLVDVKESWHGPGAWRSKGNNWSYEYVLRSVGILKSVQIGK